MSEELCRNYHSVFIDGEWVEPDRGDRLEDINPATEEPIGMVVEAGMVECELALASARRAFDRGDWSDLEPRKRAEILERFVDLIEARSDQVISLMVEETGTPLLAAGQFMFAPALEIARHYLKLAGDELTYLTPLEINLQFGGGSAMSAGVVAHEPVGVVLCITPFNAPLFLNLGKLIPALAMGNTVILKPSPLTPMQGLFLGDIALELGLPPGVLNVITGSTSVSEKLTADPRVDLVSFTGSDLVGASIMRQVAPTLKRIMLELGGKSANIVCADTDVDAAAMYAMAVTATLAGQGCAISTRHLVHNSIYKAFLERVAQVSSAFVCGDTRSGATVLGPLISASQRQRVEDYVQIGLDNGGRLICGGRRPEHMEKGYYHEATMFADLDNSCRLAREEIFGPVGLVMGFDTEDEAIAIANDCDYGLAGNVFCRDTGQAFALARRMRTGSVSINGGSGAAMIKQPFGGIKRSGFGRENGIDGLMEYSFKKTISFRAA